MQALGISTIVLVLILAAIAWHDFRTQTIPDTFNAALAISGAAVVWVGGFITPTDAVLGAVVGALASLGLRVAFRAFRGVDGLGLGDIKFLAGAGLWTGLSGLPWLILVASISGLSMAMALLIATKTFTRETRLAFGPHLAVGLFATWIFKLNGML